MEMGLLPNTPFWGGYAQNVRGINNFFHIMGVCEHKI
jgi:hypothetical protein